MTESRGNEGNATTGFLDLIARDIDQHPERIVFATEAFAAEVAKLTAGMEVDYDTPIDGDFEI